MRRVVTSGALSRGTTANYTAECRRFATFCREHGYPFFPTTTEAVISFLVTVAARRETHPKSRLFASRASIGSLYRYYGEPAPTAQPEVTDAITSLCALCGIEDVPDDRVFDIPTVVRFVRDNVLLQQGGMLRERAMMLLAICVMARPSDLSGLKWSHIVFDAEGRDAQIAFFDGKTDKLNTGWVVRVGRATDASVCPIAALERWRDEHRATLAPKEAGDAWAASGPVFPNSVTAPYTQKVHPETIGNALQRVLQKALGGGTWTARHIRRSSATFAIRHLPLERVMMLGRWRDADTVRRYYLRNRPGRGETDTLLGQPCPVAPVAAPGPHPFAAPVEPVG